MHDYRSTENDDMEALRKLDVHFFQSNYHSYTFQEIKQW